MKLLLLVLHLLLAVPAYAQDLSEPLDPADNGSVPDIRGNALSWTAIPLRPTNTPPTCKVSRYGWIYVDLSLRELCICTPSSGAKWCNLRTQACGTAGSCG